MKYEKNKVKELINENELVKYFAEIINENEKIYSVVEYAENTLIEQIMNQEKICFPLI